MPVICGFPCLSGVERIGFVDAPAGLIVDAVPDAVGPTDPGFVIDIGLNGYGIVPRLAEEEDIVTQGRTQPGGIFLELAKGQPFAVNAYGLGLGVFRDDDLAMIQPAPLTHGAHGLPAKVLE